MKSISFGIDVLSSSAVALKRENRTGILCHPASLSCQNWEHLESIAERKSKLTTLFGPQHGIHGETQDNMIEWRDCKDSKGRPVYSLYGERRKPSPESLRGLDVMVIDLFDVGSRYYTFIYTMAYMLEACAKEKIPVVLCDRPNPLNGLTIEGPILNREFKSFVGLYEIPVRHGMTIAELALLFSEKMIPKPNLKILKMKGWSRKYFWSDLKAAWTLPSPNMPNFEAALLYPGMCLLEGTSLSEGRGTTRPFELIGAPFFDWNKIEKEYLKMTKSLKMQPVHFHRQGFIPTFHKYQGELCQGALQMVRNPQNFQPLRHMTVLLSIFRQLYGNRWSWKRPPYEYEFEKLPIDILAGGTELRDYVDRGASLDSLFKKWKKDEEAFKKSRRPFLLYK